MTTAGQELVAGRVPGERIATTVRTADSSTTTTTNLEVDTVTADVVAGRTYKVIFYGWLTSDTASDRVVAGVIEGSGGTILQETQKVVGAGSSSFDFRIETEWTAGSDGTQDFVSQVRRVGGSGNVKFTGGTTHPNRLYVEYAYG